VVKKVQIVCGTCGSADVRADAYAAWNTETQEWELTATFDKGSVCEVCEGETRTEEVPLDQWEAAIKKDQLLHSPRLGIQVEVGVVFYDDEEKWRGRVGDEDVGGLFTTRLLYDEPEEAKDAARRWVMNEGQD
jgi:hypothetical protein